jgi:putative ATP-dependent endonuclease of OLD family
MRITRVQIENFRNFKSLDVKTGDNLVIVGENKVGKTNFLYALRLVLDPTLPESNRWLEEKDFWDGLETKISKDVSIKVSIDLTDFEYNDDLLAVLAEHIVDIDPLTARLTYLFRPIPGKEIKSLEDYEPLTYGGDRLENRFAYELRRRIALEVLPALRDAESDLASQRNSPLQRLIDQIRLDRAQLNEVSRGIQEATSKVLEIPDQDDPTKRPILEIQNQIQQTLEDFVGVNQAFEPTFGFAPLEAERLLHSLKLMIDGGKRTIAEASTGSANALYVVLKELELRRDSAQDDNSRFHTILGIEEPEAHLHPHMQRMIYKDFLRPRQHQVPNTSSLRPARTILLTTHSPHIVSVAPLRSIILLKPEKDENSKIHSIGVSANQVNLDQSEIEDIERYLDVNRGEILFSRAVILVEGEAELYLVPKFAALIGYPLDEYGVTVCSVGGTNFLPYAKLLGKRGFNISFVVITDMDPQENSKPPLAQNRVIKLLQEILGTYQDDSNTWKEDAIQYGIFINQHTLEIDLSQTALEPICRSLKELTDNQSAQKRADQWLNAPDQLDTTQLIKDIESIGKGRFAQRLTQHVKAEHCPEYIKKAIEYAVNQSKQ